MLLVGVAYVGLILLRSRLMEQLLDVPFQAGLGYVRTRGNLHQSANAAAYALPLFLLAVLAFDARPGGLRHSLRGIALRRVAFVSGATVLASIALSYVGLWPYSWQTDPSPAAIYLANLVLGGQWLGVVLLLAITILATPIIEECVFRFGLLQFLHRWLRSRVLAVGLSSAVFAFLHLGPNPLGADFRALVSVGWLFVLGLVLGIVTLRDGGRLATAVAIHMARNATEAIVLLYVVFRALPA